MVRFNWKIPQEKKRETIGAIVCLVILIMLYIIPLPGPIQTILGAFSLIFLVVFLLLIFIIES